MCGVPEYLQNWHIALQWSAASHGVYFHSEERPDVETNIEISPPEIAESSNILVFKQSLSFCGNLAPNSTVTTRRFPGQVRSGIFDPMEFYRIMEIWPRASSVTISVSISAPWSTCRTRCTSCWPLESQLGSWGWKIKGFKKRELEHQSLHTKKVKV